MDVRWYEAEEEEAAEEAEAEAEAHFWRRRLRDGRAGGKEKEEEEERLAEEEEDGGAFVGRPTKAANVLPSSFSLSLSSTLFSLPPPS